MVAPKEDEIPVTVAVPVEELAKLNPLIRFTEKFLTDEAVVFVRIPVTILDVAVVAPAIDKL
ncbi:hypothetical protein D3C80_1062670 [compost metagenome]